MKDLFDSYFYKISNLIGLNVPTYNETEYGKQESYEDFVHLSYSDYVKYINEEERKKASPLQPDDYSI